MKTVRSALLMGVIALGAAAVIAAPAAQADTVHETWRPGWDSYNAACVKRYAGEGGRTYVVNDIALYSPNASNGWDGWWCIGGPTEAYVGGLDMTHDVCRANGYREANRDSDGPYGQFCWR